MRTRNGQYRRSISRWNSKSIKISRAHRQGMIRSTLRRRPRVPVRAVRRDLRGIPPCRTRHRPGRRNGWPWTTTRRNGHSCQQVGPRRPLYPRCPGHPGAHIACSATQVPTNDVLSKQGSDSRPVVGSPTVPPATVPESIQAAVANPADPISTKASIHSQGHLGGATPAGKSPMRHPKPKIQAKRLGDAEQVEADISFPAAADA